MCRAPKGALARCCSVRSLVGVVRARLVQRPLLRSWGVSMTETWFVQADGKEFGPLSINELQQLYQQGVVSRNAFASTDRQSWKKIDQLGFAHSEEQSPDLSPPPLPKSTASNSPKADPTDAWLIQSYDGQRYGPITRVELKQWVKDGVVTAACMIWRQGWPEWKPAASEFPEVVPSNVGVAGTNPTVNSSAVPSVSIRRDNTDKAAAEGGMTLLVLAALGVFMFLLVSIPKENRIYLIGAYVVLGGLLRLMSSSGAKK